MSLDFRTRWFLGAAAAASTLAYADNPVIEDIAPKDAFLVVSVPNWPQAKSAFMRSPAGALWQDKSMKDWLDKMWKQIREEAEPEAAELLGELTEKLDEIGEPTGSLGAAWTLSKGTSPASEGGGEAPLVPGMLLLADFGENGQKAEATIVEYLEAQAAKNRLKITPVTVAGIEAHEIELIVELSEDADPADPDVDQDLDAMEEEDFGGEPPIPDLDDILTGGEGGPVKLFFARSAGSLVVTSTKDTLEHALDRVGGANRPHLSENAEWSNAIAQHPKGGHLFAAFFLNDSVRTMLGQAGEGLGAEAVPLPLEEMGLEFEKVMGTLGLLPLKAVSLGARLDAEVGGEPALEQTFGILLPEKKGLFTLIEGDAAPFEPPTWITADAASTGRYHVRFERIVPLLEEIVKTLPPDIQNFASGGVQFVKTSFGPALDVMGPEIYSMGMITRPLSAKSQADVYAIKVRDELVVANAISGMAAQAGMEARDFAGAQIYDAPDDSMSIGLGFGWLFLGTGSGVENGMRAAANPAEAGEPLAKSERFRRAVTAANAAGTGLFQSWTDDQIGIDYAMWAAQNPMVLMRAEWEAMGLSAAEVDEIMEGMEAEVPAWIKDLPSADVFKKYIDCSAMSIRSTPDGFRATYITLPPKKP